MTTDNFFVFIYKTGRSKQVKQEVNSRVILPPLVFSAHPLHRSEREREIKRERDKEREGEREGD